jgi:hypothetical protein
VKTVLIGALVVAAVVSVWMIVTSMRGRLGPQVLATELDRTVVEEYCRLVAEGRYAEAWERCLTADYRRKRPVEDFVAAHERRRAEVGTVQGRRMLTISSTRQLFTWVRELQLLYAVDYPGREERLYIVLSDADGQFRVDGTHEPASPDTLNPIIW